MSEEILEALAVLFGIISKQDGGVTDGLRNFVVNFFRGELESQNVDRYLTKYDTHAEYGEFAKKEEAEEEEPAPAEGAEGGEPTGEKREKRKKKGTRVNDSLRILKLCRQQFNSSLNQQQKVIVLVKMLELLDSDKAFTTTRKEIVKTISDVFNVDAEEYKRLEAFVMADDSSLLDHEDYLVFDESAPTEGTRIRYIDSGYLDGEIIFVRVSSVGLYFTKYTGNDEIFLNSRQVPKGIIMQFAAGSIFRTPKGAPLYYSDLVSHYNSDKKIDQLSFNALNIEFRFPNNAIGLRDVNISEGPGKLIGIMGASGAGKTTLLNVLAGLEKPYQGEVRINGYNIHTEKDKVEGVIGYIAQDDLLIEELSVFQNLYYNAKLCFRDLTEQEITERVLGVLANLGLERIKDLKVGNVLNKKISGGQRKRLNIALELIREPAVMFVDEPTSGLSSRDSENVIDLLKELALKGKLIFVVIHQPSSDIYKMFDKMIIMDTGGFPIFTGNPIEAVTYFKTAAHQVGSDRGQCMTCGNVNPEQIFNIVEARVVDEYGEFTNKRKVQPEEWYGLFKEQVKIDIKEDIKDAPPQNLKIPSWFSQTFIFTIRDFLSKISNKQYMLINLLEAPMLALLLSLIIRYKGIKDGVYLYRHNENIPAFILICIIVALFMGLTVSAEEIIRDRKIQKRESFLNLSRSSYLVSKLLILFALSAIQTFTFVMIGNSILEVREMYMVYWLMLFSVSCHANVLGLNISSAFNSAVTVYIIIPLLLIPQMILSGAIFNFDKLNNWISDKGKVPILADLMASRWSYEALSVEQYRGNFYTKNMFPFEMVQSEAKFKYNYWIPEVMTFVEQATDYLKLQDKSGLRPLPELLKLVENAYEADRFLKGQFTPDYYAVETFTVEKGEALKAALEATKERYSGQLVSAEESIDSVKYSIKERLAEGYKISDVMDVYFNDKLESVMRNESSKDKFIEQNFKLVQMMDPGFQYPPANQAMLNYRSHFYAPVKNFGGNLFDTFWFNVCVIWIMTIALYIALYFDWLAKIVKFLSDLGGKGD